MSDIVFQGTSEIALDAKGRITVPVRQRDALIQTCDGLLTLTKHPRGFLLLMPRPRWEQMRERLLALNLGNESWRRVFVGNAVDLEIDGAARILVPPELRKAAGLVRDVRLVGNGRLLEVWDAARHDAHEAALAQQPMPPEIEQLVL